jgi:hypothetical protein
VLVGRNTPARLRFVSISIAALALIAGLVAALVVSERQSATSSAWQTAEPLMVTAQAADTSLSDADTTAAASFLQGRIQPLALQTRYSSDLTNASADVAAAAREAGSDPAIASGIRTLSIDLPAYAGIVQEADFNQRQGSYPLAAAYLAEASHLMRTEILPAAAQVYGTEVDRLSNDQNQAVSPWLAVLAVLALVALLFSLVLAQRWLSNTFHRTWNVALAVATVIVLILGIWSTVALVTQNSGVNTAEASGSHPVSTFTEARILALRMRADDELALLTHDADPSYQRDYARTDAALRHLLGASNTSGASLTSFEQHQLEQARSSLASYEAVHRELRSSDTNSDPAAAILVAKQKLPPASAELNAALAAGINGSQSTFVDSTSGAASDLDGLVWALAIGTILVAVLVLIGFQPRIEEYQ